MRAIMAAASGLLHLLGGVIVCGNLLLAPPPQAVRAMRTRYRPGDPLTADEARAWADLVAQLCTPPDGGPPARLTSPPSTDA